MNFPQLRMQSTKGELGLTITKAVQQIEQPQADMTIRQRSAEMDIETTPGKLIIDQTQAWADMNLMHIFKRIEEYARNGYQDWLSYLAKTSSQGDQLMRIENKGNPLISQAKMNSESPILDYNVGFIPSAFSVKMNYRPAKVNINWKTHQPDINVKVNKPRHHYSPGVVRGKMKQMPSLHIEVIGLNIDQKK
ncbi:DUF6470 family protein [Fictibacillus sp. b24]|uniref:DUF6470 family protein n=1 Tax=Fictibacillus sp. b24 TaxID=3055863 RepID=UPI0025A057D4|nr:DUF6470 family protein [Fictibacillus sp. b24]MDM5315079.1 DUF6470 family protein [Fictibacillus sp. b24]